MLDRLVIDVRITGGWGMVLSVIVGLCLKSPN
jgi:hypothetical protein